MKLIRSKNWIRLRGQVGPNKEIAKIDTPVSDKERVFFIPETEEEKTYFSIDMALNLTNIPQGPSSHNPDEPWGWRLYPSRTEEDMKRFAESIHEVMNTVYNQGIASLTGKKTLLN